jgi:predicted small lipoprotein YifL
MTRAIIVLTIATLALAACGKRGELQRPGPRFDEPTRTAPAK